MVVVGAGLAVDPNLIEGELAKLPAEPNLIEGELSGGPPLKPLSPNLLATAALGARTTLLLWRVQIRAW